MSPKRLLIGAVLIAVRTALLAGVTLFSYTGLRMLATPETPTTGPDVPFDAFTVSIWPVVLILSVLFWIWEGMGQRASLTGYVLAAPVIAYLTLEGFFYVAYAYGPTFPPLLFEALLLLAFAIGGAAVFGVSRLTNRA